jgi:hypothetical protein
MKYAVDVEHREYFQNNKLIEFDNLLSEEQVVEIQKAINETLLKRLGVSLAQFKNESSKNIFMAGHDLWRSSDEIKKLITQRKLAEYAAELTFQKHLRLGYDQLIFEKFFEDLMHPNLQEISSIQGVVCGLMICLSSSDTEQPSTSVFSSKSGNGIYFSSEFPIDFAALGNMKNQYLLIAYTSFTSVYVAQRLDPNANYLKKLGYNLGDKLRVKHHPIVFK